MCYCLFVQFSPLREGKTKESPTTPFPMNSIDTVIVMGLVQWAERCFVKQEGWQSNSSPAADSLHSSG